jgi:hypothetical protein
LLEEGVIDTDNVFEPVTKLVEVVVLCVPSVVVATYKTCSTLPKPVAVPLLVSVAPLGMVMVSPLAPKVNVKFLIEVLLHRLRVCSLAILLWVI